MTEPTDRQQRFYDFFVKFINDNGVSPTVRDVMLGLGFSSPNAVVCHVDALIRKGRLRRVGSGQSRSVVPVVDGTCPLCGHVQETGVVGHA